MPCSSTFCLAAKCHTSVRTCQIKSHFCPGDNYPQSNLNFNIPSNVQTTDVNNLSNFTPATRPNIDMQSPIPAGTFASNNSNGFQFPENTSPNSVISLNSTYEPLPQGPRYNPQTNLNFSNLTHGLQNPPPLFPRPPPSFTTPPPSFITPPQAFTVPYNYSSPLNASLPSYLPSIRPSPPLVSYINPEPATHIACNPLNPTVLPSGRKRLPVFVAITEKFFREQMERGEKEWKDHLKALFKKD